MPGARRTRPLVLHNHLTLPIKLHRKYEWMCKEVGLTKTGMFKHLILQELERMRNATNGKEDKQNVE